LNVIAIATTLGTASVVARRDRARETVTREVEVDVEDDRGRRVDRGEEAREREGRERGDARDGVRGIENKGAGGRRAGAVERDGGGGETAGEG